MHIIYDDSGQFKIGRIISEAESSLQMETLSGKRGKIKKNQIIFRFDAPPQGDLTAQARAQAETLNIPFLWECAPQGEFSVDVFAADYFGEQASILDKLSLLLALHDAPIYFHRKGRGLYSAAPPDILEAALQAQEKKRKREAQIQTWTAQLTAFEVPEELHEALPGYLTDPDKNSPGWKAFEAALAQTGLSAPAMLLKLGVYRDELDLFWALFLAQHFPKGIQQPPQPLPDFPALPPAEVTAYSIDSASTTEIDDALAVRHLHDAVYQISVHIAAPAMLITPGSAADLAARSRMSTLYVPGTKIPMQADNIIETFSLDEGCPRPAVSLYVTVDIETGELLSSETRTEMLTVCKNLRIEDLESLLTPEALESPAVPIPYPEFFRPLWKMAKHLKTQREAVRGKPEVLNRADYNFVLEGDPRDMNSRVQITRRQRNAPLDQIVAEYMILANSTWAGKLKELGLTGIFRSQNGGRVRQSCYPELHESIGVHQYGWMTSPLRRYVDLLNQQQLLCGLEHGVSARLAAPYQPKSIELMSIMSQFETVYNQWRSFQDKMERYWSLRWLQQQKKQTVRAHVIRDKLVRLEDAPLTAEIDTLPPLDKDAAVEIAIDGINLLELKLEARFLDVLPTIQEPT